MLKIDCRKCDKCTGCSCKVYGNDANKAVKQCADDGFKEYKVKDVHTIKTPISKF